MKKRFLSIIIGFFVFYGLYSSSLASYSNIIERNSSNENGIPFGYIPKYDFNKNDSFRDFLTISNKENSSVDYSVYIVEATFSDRGNLTATLKKDPRNENSILKNAIKFEKEIITVPPSESIPFYFTVNNENLPPGTYNGSIVYEKINKIENQNVSGLSFTVRNAINFLLIVPGEPIYSYEISEAKITKNLKGYTFSRKIENTGNSLIRYSHKLTLFDEISEPVTLQTENKFLPKDTAYTIETIIPINKYYGKSIVTSEIQIERYDTQTANFIPLAEKKEAFSFLVIPWDDMLLAISGFFILLFFTLFMILINKKYIKKCVIYKTKDKESIYEIAEKFKMSWKKLAKINRIKAPFVIKKGQNLLVKDKSAKTKK